MNKLELIGRLEAAQSVLKETVFDAPGLEDALFWCRQASDNLECSVQLIRETIVAEAGVPKINEAIVTFFGQPMKVACDRQCHKSWGINGRPRIQLSDNPDDFCWLADGELGEAPVNPGTYEGGVAKPTSPDQFPQKWCIRECERCAKSSAGESELPLELPSFVERVFNIKARNT